MMDAGLYFGRVMHKRFTPKPHSFSYRVFTLFANIDDLPEMANKNRFFGVNRFNILSFYEKDYGDASSSKNLPLKERLQSLLSQNNIEVPKGFKVWVLTYPRILGFSFNPITVFYCYCEKGKQIAVIYEVRNTFGERHNYIFKADPVLGLKEKHFANKVFHVSPFFDRKGTYQFTLKEPKEKVAVTIDYCHKGQKRLKASFVGKHIPFTDKAILSLTSKMPFMTLKVVAGILFEALILWVKGMKIYTHPEKHAYQSTPASGAQTLSKTKTSEELA